MESPLDGGFGMWRSLSFRAVASKALGEALGGVVSADVGGDPLGGAADGVEDGGVVTISELPTDGGERSVGQLPREVHGELARPGDARGTAGRDEIVEGEAERVGGEDQLGPDRVQGVEGVEELLLGPHLGLEALDVVDEQDVGAAVRRLEAVDRAGVQGADVLARERVGGGAADAEAAAVGLDEG